MNLGAFQDRRSDLFRGTIKHNWYIIVVCALIGAAAGYYLAEIRPVRFTSSTTVLVNPIIGNPYTPDSNSDTLEMLQTEAVSVTSQRALTDVQREIGKDLEVAQIRNRTTVTVPPNTQALKITYTDVDRAEAAPVVDEIAEVFLAQREELANEAVENRTDAVLEELDEVNRALQEARQTDDGGALEADLVSQRFGLQGQLRELQAQPRNPGRVLTPGFEPSESQTQHILLFSIALGILGAIGGFLLALVRERRRDLIRDPGDLSDYAFDAPVTSIQGRELDEDALRHLRMRLAPQIRDHGIISLVGLRPGHALSAGVLLARSLATGGTSVVLIDATGTEAGHQDPVDHEDSEGLSEALMGVSARVPSAYQVEKNFNYLPAGENAFAASERLVTDRARTVIHGVAERYDLTMVASMPLDEIEGEAVARLTAGVLLLVEIGRSSHFQVGSALNTIQTQGRRLLGVFVLPRGT